MNDNKLTRNTAIQQIKEVIYDLQMGETEIVPAAKLPLMFKVKFDNWQGRPGEVLIAAGSTYRQMYMALKSAYRGGA
ncbi:MAG: hypothetical protein WC829_09685 [Hyphomicrobium sp.]|jgi:hypothetical protein